MHVGIAVDHGGYALKEDIANMLRAQGHAITDFGADHLSPDDDYPDFVIPLARAVADGDIERGIAICGSGVGACIAANKIPGARACLIQDCFSAHQGVEDDDLNILCLGGRVIGPSLAQEVIRQFLAAEFRNTERYTRRLEKIRALES